MKAKITGKGSPWEVFCAALLLLIATDLPAGTVYGPRVTLEKGTARTYLILDEQKRPMEIGVALDEDFMAGLPADGAPDGVTMPDGHSTFEYLLEMPATNPTPFRHVTLDWNPSGHIPAGIYDRPHFDVHFYLIDDAERQAIRPDDPEFMAKARRLPPAEYIPPGYYDLNTPPIPLMGLHLLDPTSPELRPADPQPFTHTLLYGSWDGRLIFIEPMLTREFLSGRPDITVPFPRAARYRIPGLYPGAYRVHWVPETAEYRIGLIEFRDHPGSAVDGSNPRTAATAPESRAGNRPSRDAADRERQAR